MLEEEARAFREESAALHALLAPLTDAQWQTPTQFKGWTLDDVMSHLHHGNLSALVSLTDRAAYDRLREERARLVAGGLAPVQAQRQSIGGISGRALLAAWDAQCTTLAEAFAVADGKKRVPWAGRDMSARSSISARLMETWAHGQEVYDLLGAARADTDRICHIATLGVNTYGWSFTNRGMAVPAGRPQVLLRAPSGAVWEWPGLEPAHGDCISGAASEFCQVVAQTRNVADTTLAVTGPTATLWMANAQCFAGPPRVPPAPGTRFRQARPL